MLCTIMFGLMFQGRVLNIIMFICTFSVPWEIDFVLQLFFIGFPCCLRRLLLQRWALGGYAADALRLPAGAAVPSPLGLSRGRRGLNDGGAPRRPSGQGGRG